MLVVFPYTEVEEEGSRGRVFDQEGEGGAGELIMAFYWGLDEAAQGDAVDLSCGVDDADFDCCV